MILPIADDKSKAMATISSKPAKAAQFVSVNRAAELLGLTPGRIRHLVGNYENHVLPATKLGKHEWIIAFSDLAKYAKKHGIELNLQEAD